VSSFDQTKRIEEFNYRIGETYKDDVISALGLPDTYLKSQEKELLGYQGKVDGRDYFIPLPVHIAPIGGDMMLVTYINLAGLTSEEVSKLREVDVIFKFDQYEILEDVIDNRGSK